MKCVGIAAAELLESRAVGVAVLTRCPIPLRARGG